MPAAEALEATTRQDDERSSYELAFHILPTVAEGEVSGVFEKVKAQIIKAGGECFIEEGAERIDLVYPIVKHIEGKNRDFTSAYFGWIRFRLMAEALGKLIEEVEHEPNILRHIVIKLTKLEEAHPFKFHENRKTVKMVEVFNEEVETLKETPTEDEESAEVSDEELEESLEKITGIEDIEEDVEKSA